MTTKRPRVLNKHVDVIPDDAVYIGRPSKWGNPFVIGKHGTRDTVIGKFEEKFLADPERVAEARRELRGKSLVCFCAPRRCHGDVLLQIANEENDLPIVDGAVVANAIASMSDR